MNQLQLFLLLLALSGSLLTEIANALGKGDVVQIKLNSGNISEYEIESELGRGGTAIVYVARKKTADSGQAPLRLALKIFLNQNGASTMVESLTVSHRLLLDNAEPQNILVHSKILDIAAQGNTFQGVVSRIALGDTTSKDIAPRMRLDDATPDFHLINNFISNTMNGLSELAQRGIVHQDVRPENIYYEIGPNGEEKFLLGDLGSSKFAGKTENMPTSYFSLFYAPPETDAYDYNAKKASRSYMSDFYSFGNSLFQLLFDGETPIEMYLKSDPKFKEVKTQLAAIRYGISLHENPQNYAKMLTMVKNRINQTREAYKKRGAQSHVVQYLDFYEQIILGSLSHDVSDREQFVKMMANKKVGAFAKYLDSTAPLLDCKGSALNAARLTP